MTQVVNTALHLLYIKTEKNVSRYLAGLDGLVSTPQFIRWNESVENQTTYKTEESLLNAYVSDVKTTSEDFIVIQLLPF